MAEELTLTTPATITGYRVKQVLFDWENAMIKVHVADAAGVKVTAIYQGTIATTLMNQLNTVNLSTNSLHKRIMDRLVADGKLPAGTVTGTPD